MSIVCVGCSLYFATDEQGLALIFFISLSEKIREIIRCSCIELDESALSIPASRAIIRRRSENDNKPPAKAFSPLRGLSELGGWVKVADTRGQIKTQGRQDHGRRNQGSRSQTQ